MSEAIVMRRGAGGAKIASGIYTQSTQTYKTIEISDVPFEPSVFVLFPIFSSDNVMMGPAVFAPGISIFTEIFYQDPLYYPRLNLATLTYANNVASVYAAPSSGQYWLPGQYRWIAIA